MNIEYDNSENQLNADCPVQRGRCDCFCVRYSVKRNSVESLGVAMMHAAIASFASGEDRDAWIEWHKANTPLFMVLDKWYNPPPLSEEAQVEKDAQTRERLLKRQRNIDLHRKKQQRWADISVAHALRNKS